MVSLPIVLPKQGAAVRGHGTPHGDLCGEERLTGVSGGSVRDWGHVEEGWRPVTSDGTEAAACLPTDLWLQAGLGESQGPGLQTWAAQVRTMHQHKEP